MTTGIIIAVLMVLLILNKIFNKSKNPKIRKKISMSHKVLGVLLILGILVHLILTLPLIKQRPIAMYVLGFVMLAAAVAEWILYMLRKKMKNNWLNIHKGIAIAMLICMFIHAGLGIGSLMSYHNKISQIQVEDIDLTQMEDGTYIGECDAGYVYAKVSVAIENGTITDVDLLEHRTERGQKAEVIPEKIEKEQKVDVDSISGATNSSKVIKQAVCNALQKKGEER